MRRQRVVEDMSTRHPMKVNVMEFLDLEAEVDDGSQADMDEDMEEELGEHMKLDEKIDVEMSMTEEFLRDSEDLESESVGEDGQRFRFIETEGREDEDDEGRVLQDIVDRYRHENEVDGIRYGSVQMPSVIYSVGVKVRGGETVCCRIRLKRYSSQDKLEKAFESLRTIFRRYDHEAYPLLSTARKRLQTPHIEFMSKRAKLLSCNNSLRSIRGCSEAP